MFKKLLAVLAIFTLCFAIMIPIGSASAAELPYISDATINAQLNEMGYPSIVFNDDNDETYIYFIGTFLDGSKILYRVYNYTGSYPDSITLQKTVTIGGEFSVRIFSDGPTFKIARYSLSSGSWSKIDSYSSTDGSVHYLSGFVYSTQDIYDENGELFFEVPRPSLAEIVLGVIKGEIPIRLQTPVVGTMRTLLLCGVGLMALLVVLNLFGKVLPQFLGRS